MKKSEVIKLIESGELIMEKSDYGMKTRGYSIYSETVGEWVELYKENRKTGKCELKKVWCGEFERYETKSYPRIEYMAMYKGTNRGYKISKTLYESLYKQITNN